MSGKCVRCGESGLPTLESIMLELQQLEAAANRQYTRLRGLGQISRLDTRESWVLHSVAEAALRLSAALADVCDACRRPLAINGVGHGERCGGCGAVMRGWPAECALCGAKFKGVSNGC